MSLAVNLPNLSLNQGCALNAGLATVGASVHGGVGCATAGAAAGFAMALPHLSLITVFATATLSQMALRAIGFKTNVAYLGSGLLTVTVTAGLITALILTGSSVGPIWLAILGTTALVICLFKFYKAYNYSGPSFLSGVAPTFKGNMKRLGESITSPMDTCTWRGSWTRAKNSFKYQ